MSIYETIGLLLSVLGGGLALMVVAVCGTLVGRSIALYLLKKGKSHDTKQH